MAKPPPDPDIGDDTSGRGAGTARSRLLLGMLESSDLHPGRSARNHLRALGLAAELPWSRVEEVLELVELESVADRRVKTYSLGMRQRLGAN